MHTIFSLLLCLMNLLASISLIFLFSVKGLAPVLDICCELQKIPNLLVHYQEHKACNSNSFLQFLINDYIDLDGDSNKDHDSSEHENLPFNGNHQCSHTTVFYASDEHFSVMVLEHTRQAEFAFYQSLHSSEFLDSPFQPPQV